jgi:hypothetical protein
MTAAIVGVDSQRRALRAVQPERVPRRPVDDDLITDRRTVPDDDILLEDRDLLLPRRHHQVLGRYAHVGHIRDPAGDAVVVIGNLAGIGGIEHRHLLRAHADDDAVAVGEAAGRRDDEVLSVSRHHEVLAGESGLVPLEQVRLAEEVGHEDRPRQFVYVRRVSQLLDATGVHDGHGVGHGHGLLLVVRDVDECRADLGLDALELDLHLPPQLQVKSAQRLVEQKDIRLIDQCARHGNALLLATRQLGRLASGHRPELDQLEHPVDLGLDILDLPSTQAEGHVLEDVEVREQRVRLEDRVHRAFERSRPGDVAVADADGAAGGVLKTGHHAQRGRLPAA